MDSKIMKLDIAVKYMKEDGRKVRRTDWGYSKTAYLTTEKFYGVWNFFINCQFSAKNESKQGYGLTFTDLESENWELVE